ncbi:uncharacterized protein KY384_000097 [Bacidia gigantensis]|uniref:uncharacterized protein n=1 Tax=Bacidia gigantensis TaxID=2732470 RepID=UPI001D051A3F|nr:uncharacterized protein KY384_000097 [Bacidia gigantensis]KAG8526104.1 hypothetical protein KY384_000097 [Bacidia gigantensis]
MAADRNAIWVPMKIDAYLNYDPRRVSNVDPRNRAYFGPISTPNYDSLGLDDGPLQHDIFEHHRDAPYMGCADPLRQLNQRQGVMLHWTLPRFYRVGIAGSSAAESVAATNDARKYGGYSMSDATYTSNDVGNPIFRSVPERWIIMRTVRAFPSGPFAQRVMVRSGDAEIQAPGSLFNQVAGDGPSIRSMFVVHANRKRDLADIPASGDVEYWSSPLLDHNLRPDQQGHKYVGFSQGYNQWTGNDNTPDPNTTTSVTVSNSANPYFADYQPLNTSVFSFRDDLHVTLSDGSLAYITQANISYTVLGYHVPEENDPLYLNPTYVSDQTFQDRLNRCGLDLNGQISNADATWLATQAGRAT